MQNCFAAALTILLSMMGAPSATARPQQDVQRPSVSPPVGLEPLSRELPDTDISPGTQPPDASRGQFESRETPSAAARGQWENGTLFWAPAETVHQPLFFEDVMLERHGMTRHAVIQPFASATRFFAGAAMLPYKFRLHPPLRTRSTYGHFRPGDPLPPFRQRPPWQRDAAAVQALSTIGGVFIIP